MSKEAVHLAASLLFLLALILIAFGVNAERPMLWSAGLLAIVVGMGFSLATRWVDGDGEDPGPTADDDGPADGPRERTR